MTGDNVVDLRQGEADVAFLTKIGVRRKQSVDRTNLNETTFAVSPIGLDKNRSPMYRSVKITRTPTNVN